MWDRVEKALDEGTLDSLKNELIIEEEIDAMDQRSRKEDTTMEDDDDDDGQFFE
jgi:hypothetical protein